MRSPESKSRAKEIENLLNILEGKEQVIVSYKNDILNFIKFYKLKSGNKRVKRTLIKRLYRNWSKDPDKHFGYKLGRYFQGKDGYFLLNRDPTEFLEYLDDKEPKKTKISIKRSYNVNQFLLDQRIAKGDNYFIHYILYYMYLEWCDLNKVKDKLTLYKFNNGVRLVLNSKRGAQRIAYFGIGRDLRMDFLTAEKMQTIKEWYTLETQKKHIKEK